MRKAFNWGLCIIISVSFLLVSIYLWLCLGISLKYDLFGFDYSDWNYDLIEWINKLYGLSLSLIGICFIVYSCSKKTERRLNRAVVFVLSVLGLYDLYAIVAALLTNKYLISVNSFGFIKQFLYYVAPLLLLFNIMTITVGFCLLLMRSKKHCLFRGEKSNNEKKDKF